MNRRQILLWVAAAATGLLIAAFLWRQAFPVASIDFRYSRAEAVGKLRDFLKSEGASIEKHQEVVAFGESDEAKVYLERELGFESLASYSARGINLWYWHGRWFVPQQQEEWGAWLDPNGNLVGYRHTIEEARPGASLTEEESRKIAEKFLQRYISQHPFERLKFVESSVTELPKRKDYTFTWECEELRVGEAPYRLYVSVQGEHVGSYGEYLKLPEAWERRYAREREVNELCQSFAQYGFLILIMGGLIRLILMIHRREFPWRGGVPMLWVGLMGVGTLALWLNGFSSLLLGYETTEVWGSFWAKEFSEAGLGLLATVLGFGLLLKVAGIFYREGNPNRVPFETIFTLRGLRIPEVYRGIWVGIAVACVHLAYVHLFYVVGRRWGVWCPVDLDYSKVLEGPFPWVGSFMTGFSASFQEEMLFRVIGIALVMKVVRVRWLALLIPAIVWAFMHSNYPQQPGYVRGVELVLIGVVNGILMQRYGLAAPLTAHYCYNAWQSALVVGQTDDWMNRIGAVVISGVPLVLGWYGWWSRHHPMSKAEAPSFVESGSPLLEFRMVSAMKEWAVSALSTGNRVILLILSLVLMTLAGVLTLPHDSFLKMGTYSLSLDQVKEKADVMVRQKGIDPSTYRSMVWAERTGTPSDYLFERYEYETLADFFKREWPEVTYRVRYYRFNEREEFSLRIDGAGRLRNWNHTIPRESEGAQLEHKEAQRLAEEALVRDYGVDLSRERLVSSDFNKEERRKDHTFEYERIGWTADEARLRTVIAVQGDEVMRFRRYVKVPETWEREQSATGWREVVIQQVNQWVGMGVMILKIGLFIILLQRGGIPWKWAFRLALIPTLLMLVNVLNALPWFYSGYSTHEPPRTYLLKSLGGLVTGALWGYASAVLKVGFVLGMLKAMFGFSPLKSFSDGSDSKSSTRLVWLFVGLSFIQIVSMVQGLSWGVMRSDESVYFSIPGVNEAIPWLNVMTSAFQTTYESLIAWGLFFALLAWIRERFRWAVPLIFLWMIFIPAAAAKTVPEFWSTVFTHSFDDFVLIILIWKVWRFDWVVIGSVLLMNYLFGSLILFLEKGGEPYRWQALPIFLLMIVVVLWIMGPRPRNLLSRVE